MKTWCFRTKRLLVFYWKLDTRSVCLIFERGRTTRLLVKVDSIDPATTRHEMVKAAAKAAWELRIRQTKSYLRELGRRAGSK
jgi:hypothetical protein